MQKNIKTIIKTLEYKINFYKLKTIFIKCDIKFAY